jgi:hypothetical protein
MFKGVITETPGALPVYLCEVQRWKQLSDIALPPSLGLINHPQCPLKVWYTSEL